MQFNIMRSLPQWGFTCGMMLIAASPLCGKEPSLFAPTELKTVSGTYLNTDEYYEAADCGECHVQQYEQWSGSLHSAAHHDRLYRAFADLAREEGGDELYLFCSACHAPGAVAAGEIPHREGHEPTFLTHEGVTCEACHSVKNVRTVYRGAGANASLVLDDSGTRYGPRKDPEESDLHTSAYSEAHTSSMLCSACHTLNHPHNGLVIENTYHEWKESPYAEADIQCQDCHMRTVEESIEVARTMKPLQVPGPTYEDGEPRANVYAHWFVGANANGELVGADEKHTEEAVRRLQSAATLFLRLPAETEPGGMVQVGVDITNVGAGHNIPTSITELREVWIDLLVSDATGRTLFRSGAIDETGKVDPNAVMYHSVLGDENGEVTHLPWRAATILKEKLIPPKTTVQERYPVTVPADIVGPLSVRAVLRYRSAPQEVLDELFGKGALPMRVVDMAEGEATIPVRSKTGLLKAASTTP